MKSNRMLLIIELCLFFLPFAVNAESRYLYNEISDHAIEDNQKSEHVISNEGIDYSKVSSDTNGKGLYVFSNTKDDEFPIYYYRGNVDNNNIILKDMCWKIVRTTSTGGIKLIYNGKYTTTGDCDGNVGIGYTKFNNNNNSLANLGYMYGDDTYVGKGQGLYWYTFDKNRSPIQENFPSTGKYLASSTVEYENGVYRLINPVETAASSLVGKYSCFSTTKTTCNVIKYIIKKETNGTKPYVVYIRLDNGDTYSSLNTQFNENKNVKFGSSFIYKDGKYIITDDVTYDISNWYNIYIHLGNNKYTCMNSNGECEKIRYLIYGQNDAFKYIELENGDSFNDALKKMSMPMNDSIIKENIDQWYESNLNDISHLFEDTPWCNNKQIPTEQSVNSSEYKEKGFDFDNSNYYIKFEEFMRYYYLEKPSFICDALDSFTVKSNLGNKSLKYPIGLLNYDEILLAGYPNSQNSDGYLNSNENWYLMSPSSYQGDSLIGAVYKNQEMTTGVMCGDCAIRPSISLKNDVILLGGDGTEEKPYRIDESKLYKIGIEMVDETKDINIEINDLTHVKSEEKVKFNITPIKGYKLNSIKIIDNDNNEINYTKTENNNEYEFIMPASDVTIIPSYERVSNSVNVEENSHTKKIVIEVNDSKAVVYEDTVKFTITPEDGYVVDYIEIFDQENNKIEYSKTKNNNEYEFVMPDTDVTIKPIYKKVDTPVINPKTSNVLILIVLSVIVILGLGTYLYKRRESMKI